MTESTVVADHLPNKIDIETALIELQSNIRTLAHVVNTINGCPEEVEFLVDRLQPRLVRLKTELGFEQGSSD